MRDKSTSVFLKAQQSRIAYGTKSKKFDVARCIVQQGTRSSRSPFVIFFGGRWVEVMKAHKIRTKDLGKRLNKIVLVNGDRY